MSETKATPDHEFDPDRYPTIEDVISGGWNTLPRPVRDYVEGGTEKERTMRRNLSALDRILLRPRILRDVTQRSTATRFVGVDLATPVMPAPVGSVAILDEGGTVASARGAHRAGTASIVPLAGRPSLEDVAAETDGPLFLQLYVWGDRPWLAEAMRRAQDAGYAGICVTVDRSVDVMMRRSIRNDFAPGTAHGPPPGVEIPADARLHAQRWDWDELEWLRQSTDLPIVLKGVMSPADADRAAGAGVDAVYVSNHGGRALDSLPSTIEVLPSITDAVAGRADIAVDGGFTCGTDVVKALALGADVVLVGRLHCWALAIGGAEGVAHTLRLLSEEVSQALALLGADSVSALDPSFLVASAAAPVSRAGSAGSA